MTPLLTRLLYVSEIVEPLTALDVHTIVGASQIKNRRADVTGMLVQTARHFLQILEGRAEPVRRLMATIADDPRHRGVQRVLEVEVTRRLFADWSMGLVVCPDLSPELETLHASGTLDFDQAHALMARVNQRRAAGEAAWS